MMARSAAVTRPSPSASHLSHGRTFTVNVLVLEFLAASVAVTVTVVTPLRNCEPGDGFALTLGARSMLSITSGRLNVTTTPASDVACAVRLATDSITGGVTSGPPSGTSPGSNEAARYVAVLPAIARESARRPGSSRYTKMASFSVYGPSTPRRRTSSASNDTASVVGPDGSVAIVLALVVAPFAASRVTPN